MRERESGTGGSLPEGGTPQDTGCRGLYEAYHKQVRRYFAKRVQCPHDVDDLVQSVFTSLMAHRRPMLNPRVYVQFVAKHQLSAYWRRRKRHPLEVRILSDSYEDCDSSIECCDSGYDPVNLLFHEETARIVHLTISGLSPVLAEALRLRLLNGLALPEAASKAGCSLLTLKKRLQRARQSFMELYTQNTSEDDRRIPSHLTSDEGLRH